MGNATLVVGVAAWKWEQYFEEVIKNETGRGFDDMTAAGKFELYLDDFLELYRERKDLLRFAQFFNVYIKSENVEANTLQLYRNMIGGLKARFHEIYLKAEQDHSIRTDEPEDKMFSKTIHLMLAAVTRYAVGLVYIPESGFDEEEELAFLKDMILREYKGIHP